MTPIAAVAAIFFAFGLGMGLWSGASASILLRAEVSPAELVAVARAEFARLYGISAEPVMQEVVRWPRAIPQYELGHAAKALRIERGAAALGGLFITGYGMRAIAFADAATNGALCGERAADYCRAKGA